MNSNTYPFEIDCFNETPEHVIINEFARAEVVKFSARRNNFIEYRNITFGDIQYWLPLSRVFGLIGITPAMLQPLFVPWWKRIFVRQSEIPAGKYDGMGCFQITKCSFQKLAKILGKPIEVWREYPRDGDHDYLFTVYP